MPSHCRKMVEPKSKKARYVRQQAPMFCHIWFICKGQLVHTRYAWHFCSYYPLTRSSNYLRLSSSCFVFWSLYSYTSFIYFFGFNEVYLVAWICMCIYVLSGETLEQCVSCNLFHDSHSLFAFITWIYSISLSCENVNSSSYIKGQCCRSVWIKEKKNQWRYKEGMLKSLPKYAFLSSLWITY